MQYEHIEMGQWYYCPGLGTMYVAGKNDDTKAVCIFDAENETDATYVKWIGPDDVSHRAEPPRPVVRTRAPCPPLEPLEVPPQVQEQVHKRPARKRARTLCTFEVTLPIPLGSTQADLAEYVQEAVMSFYKSDTHSQGTVAELDTSKVRVKLVRKTTFY